VMLHDLVKIVCTYFRLVDVGIPILIDWQISTAMIQVLRSGQVSAAVRKFHYCATPLTVLHLPQARTTVTLVLLTSRMVRCLRDQHESGSLMLIDFTRLSVQHWDLQLIDKTTLARMPWHDISLAMLGGPVLDVIRHACERWNFIKASIGCFETGRCIIIDFSAAAPKIDGSRGSTIFATTTRRLWSHTEV
jgi:hypothetical protein